MKIKKKILNEFLNSQKIFILFILTIGIILRFCNISWGSPFFFHPDERNISSSISQLIFPSQMDPHFFAYGSFPIYTVFFLGLLQNFIAHPAKTTPLQVTFEDAIIMGRVVSAVLSVVILFLIYKVSLIIGNKFSAKISLSLAALSVGYIQYAHFSTFEMWLSFLTLLFTYSLVNYLKSRKVIHWVIIGVEVGLLVSVKISSLVFLPIAFFIMLGIDFLHRKKITKFSFLRIEKLLLKVLVSIGACIITVFATSPFFWLDNASFRSSIQYEVDVATGKVPVFYTQGFINSIPVFHQIFKVYPFILNPFIEAAFFIFLPYVIYLIIKKRNLSLFIVILMFIATFFSQAFLYAKWTRYYIPSIGFIYILVGYSLSELFLSRKSFVRKFAVFFVVVTILGSIIYAYAYTTTVLARKDSREVASMWASSHINSSSIILSETYDLGITPFNPYFKNITLFNFYDLDSNPNLKEDLQQKLSKTDYIILPSQRLIRSRLINSKNFPVSAQFYSNLKNEHGYKKIYETPCDFMCKILYFGDPIFNVEETANVFDRPTVIIFEKSEKKE